MIRDAEDAKISRTAAAAAAANQFPPAALRLLSLVVLQMLVTVCSTAAPCTAVRTQQRRRLRPAAAVSSHRHCAAAPGPRRAAAPAARRASHLAAAGRYEAPASAAGSAVVEVQPDEAAVAECLCSAVEAAAQAAIAERGVFTLAIPGGRCGALWTAGEAAGTPAAAAAAATAGCRTRGGRAPGARVPTLPPACCTRPRPCRSPPPPPRCSVLKALAGLQGRAVDWSRTRIFWVNHKCVPNEDATTSSTAKARALFLDAVGAPGCVVTLRGSDDAEVRRRRRRARQGGPACAA